MSRCSWGFPCRKKYFMSSWWRLATQYIDDGQVHCCQHAIQNEDSQRNLKVCLLFLGDFLDIFSWLFFLKCPKPEGPGNPFLGKSSTTGLTTYLLRAPYSSQRACCDAIDFQCFFGGVKCLEVHYLGKLLQPRSLT